MSCPYLGLATMLGRYRKRSQEQPLLQLPGLTSLSFLRPAHLPPNVRAHARAQKMVGKWATLLARRGGAQWYGLPPLLFGIVMCQIGRGSCPIHEQGGVRHEGYNDWNRFGKERVSDSRHR